MRKILYTLLTTLTLTAFTCEKETPLTKDIGDVTLVLKGNFSNQLFILNKKYQYNGIPLHVSRLSFYLSDLTLLAQPDDPSSMQDKEIPLSDVILVDFENAHADSLSALQGEKFTFKDLPAAQYKGLRIGLGVYQELNRKKPNAFSSTHPLSLPINYWQTWNSYIFSKLEGKTNPATANEKGFLYHTGTDNLYRQVVLTEKSFTIVKNVDNQLVLQLDISKILTDGTNSIDIIEHNFSHTNPEDLEEVQTSTLVTNNFAKAFKME